MISPVSANTPVQTQPATPRRAPATPQTTHPPQDSVSISPQGRAAAAMHDGDGDGH
jgi:hypothetical protein